MVRENLRDVEELALENQSSVGQHNKRSIKLTYRVHEGTPEWSDEEKDEEDGRVLTRTVVGPQEDSL